jgi:hypothetical protein
MDKYERIMRGIMDGAEESVQRIRTAIEKAGRLRYDINIMPFSDFFSFSFEEYERGIGIKRGKVVGVGGFTRVRGIEVPLTDRNRTHGKWVEKELRFDNVANTYDAIDGLKQFSTAITNDAALMQLAQGTYLRVQSPGGEIELPLKDLEKCLSHWEAELLTEIYKYQRQAEKEFIVSMEAGLKDIFLPVVGYGTDTLDVPKTPLTEIYGERTRSLSSALSGALTAIHATTEVRSLPALLLYQEHMPYGLYDYIKEQGARLSAKTATERMEAIGRLADAGSQVADLVLRRHNAGWYDEDLKPGNFLYDKETGKVINIDAGGLSLMPDSPLARFLPEYAEPEYILTFPFTTARRLRFLRGQGSNDDRHLLPSDTREQLAHTLAHIYFGTASGSPSPETAHLIRERFAFYGPDHFARGTPGAAIHPVFDPLREVLRDGMDESSSTTLERFVEDVKAAMPANR